MWADDLPINQYGSVNRQCARKRGYDSKRAARKGAATLGQRFQVVYRVYRCPICRRWHLAKERDQ